MNRVLPKALKDYFDAKVQYKLDRTNKELLIAAAKSCIGITNVGPENKGPMVELFQSVLTTPWGEPWCMDFVQACLSYVEEVKGFKSPLYATESVLDLWQKSPDCQTTEPQPGDIIIWRLGQTMSGHCGIITGSDSLSWWTVEGNTSDSIDIDRLGDGVFPKKRARGGTKTFSEVGFLTCFP